MHPLLPAFADHSDMRPLLVLLLALLAAAACAAPITVPLRKVSPESLAGTLKARANQTRLLESKQGVVPITNFMDAQVCQGAGAWAGCGWRGVIV